MAQRNRPQGRPGFKPTIATVAQLEELTEQIKAVLSEFGTRLAITEHAVSQLIQDFYYSDDVEVPTEQEGKKLKVDDPAETGALANAEDMDQALFEQSLDAEFERQKELEYQQTQAEADWDNDGGAHV